LGPRIRAGGDAYAFETLGVKELFAGHNPSNAASRLLLTRMGFRYVRDEYYPPTGLNHPSYILTAEQFTQMHQ
jgi:RimJ/RimL family protein N-acetyltransferase